MTTVAIVGTGRMGSAMARAIVAGGADLVVCNRTPGTARALAEELDARAVETPAEAAAAAEVAITMLADGDAVRETWDGPRGLVAGAQAGGVLVDSSTVPPDTITPFEPAVRERGAGIVDAPVSGSTALATKGELTIMAGGTVDDLERARPALDLVARAVTHVGPLGSGAALKLAVNALIFALNTSVSEALVLAERAGIDRALAYDVFASSAAGAPYVGYKREAFVDPLAAPVAFSLALADKDLRLILELADRLGVPMSQSLVNRRLVTEATDRLGPDVDMSQLAVHLRRLATEEHSLT